MTGSETDSDIDSEKQNTVMDLNFISDCDSVFPTGEIPDLTVAVA